MYARHISVFLITCLIFGCGKTHRPEAGLAPAISIHPVVEKPSPGALEFFADGLVGSTTAYYFPDRELKGIHFESASFEPTQTTNYVYAQLGSADRDKLQSFATAHPEAKSFGIRFESTPAGPEAGGGMSRGAVIVQVFTMRDLSNDGRLRFSRATREAADELAKRLAGR